MRDIRQALEKKKLTQLLSQNGAWTVSEIFTEAYKSSANCVLDLKYDNCNIPEEWVDEYDFCVPDQGNVLHPNGTCPFLMNPAPEGYDWGTSKTAERYRRMRDALEAQDRPILLSLCNWGEADVISWAEGFGVSWRMSLDIFREYPGNLFDLHSC